MAKARRNVHNGGQQLPLIVPDSAWTPPTELPDLRQCKYIALDRETKDDGLAHGRGPGWAHRAGHIAGCSVAWNGGAFYAPLRHPDTENISLEAWERWEREHIAAGVRFIMHNASYDLSWGNVDLGLPLPPSEQIECTNARAVLIDESALSHGLDNLCKAIGLPGKDEGLLREAAAAYGYEGSYKSNLWRLPARYVGPYAEQDTRATLALFEHQEAEMEAQELHAAYRLEMDLVPMVHEMRKRGIRIDLEAVARTQEKLFERRDEALEQLRGRLGTRVGLDEVRSATWLEAAFAKEGLPFERTEKLKQGSFKAPWMRHHPHWLPQLISKARDSERMAKVFLGDFIAGYSHRGRLHASIHQYLSDEDEDRGGTRTSRFSYSDPPLQQMPARDEELSALIRGAFLPEEGEIWGSFDYCHDDKTEILTENGWVYFKNLKNQKVAQWADGVIEFVKPTDKYIGPRRKRKMIEVKGIRQVNFCVTPDHRCLLLSHRAKLSKVLPARQIHTYLEKSIVPQCGMLEGHLKVHPALVRLIVALQADSSDRSKYGHPWWIFYLLKPRKIKRLIWILEELGCEYKLKENAKGNQTGISVKDDPRFREFLAAGKTFILETLLNLTSELRDVFLDELPHWDGSQSKRPGSGSYGSINLINCDTVQAIAACTGRRATLHSWKKLRPDQKPFTSMVFSKKLGTWGSYHMGPKTIDYIGAVYCVTVPSGFIVTRRDGHTLVSGNSQQEYRQIVHFAALKGCDGAAEAVERYQNDPETDFHLFVAEITNLERKPAKDTNFAKSYGAGVPKFALMTGMTIDKARETMEQYDRELPFVKQISQIAESLAQQRGWVKLLDGARIHFNKWEAARWADNRDEYDKHMPPRPLEMAREAWAGKPLKRADTRKALNALVQGSSARQTKLAGRACWREGYLPLIQMHDEWAFSLNDPLVAQRIQELMRDVVKLKVPMKVDAEFGLTWGHARKVKGGYGATWDEARALQRAA